VLAAAGLRASERDVLVPAAGTEIGDGDRIALRRARLLTLVVDGKEKQVWVTASPSTRRSTRSGCGTARWPCPPPARAASRSRASASR
jgi:hypothetical protein